MFDKKEKISLCTILFTFKSLLKCSNNQNKREMWIPH